MAKLGPKPRTAEELMEFIEENSIPVPFCGCRIWLGHTRKGYASVSFNGEEVYASRFICEQTYGIKLPRKRKPRGINALHSCSIKCCVEPSHIYPGTQTQNYKDSMSYVARVQLQHNRQWMKE